MITLITKPGCTYCTVFKQHLDTAGLTYLQQTVTTGVAPILQKDGQTIFTGLPNFIDLQTFLASEGIDYAGPI